VTLVEIKANFIIYTFTLRRKILILLLVAPLCGDSIFNSIKSTIKITTPCVT